MTTTKPFAFVLMPFDAAFADVYKIGIQETCAQLDVVAQRVDEQIYSETILERIYRQIEAADFVIADMTGRNPNVFYEVGYAHAKGKICVLLTQDAADIPFDLKHHRHIVYDNLTSLRCILADEIAWCLQKLAVERVVPVSADIRTPLYYFDRHEDYRDEGRLDLVIEIHNPTGMKSPDIDALYLHSGKDWTFTQDGQECPSRPVDGAHNFIKHFVRSPVPRLAPGAWAQVKLKGEKDLWTKWSGAVRQEQYSLAGRLRFEVSTATAAYVTDKLLDLELVEIPF